MPISPLTVLLLFNLCHVGRIVNKNSNSLNPSHLEGDPQALQAQVSKHGHLHDVFYRQRHLKYEQLKHCVGKTKTNHVVLQTLSTTFQFLRALWILVLRLLFNNHILSAVRSDFPWQLQCDKFSMMMQLMHYGDLWWSFKWWGKVVLHFLLVFWDQTPLTLVKAAVASEATKMCLR